MGYEQSVFTMTLLRLDYLVHSLSNCAMTVLPTDTDLYESVHAYVNLASTSSFVWIIIFPCISTLSIFIYMSY